MNEEAKEVETVETEEQGNGELSLEDLAEDMGWTKQEEWQGKDEDWVDAETFIRNADKIQKQQSGDMKKLKGQITSLTSRIEEMSVNQTKAIKTALDSAKERWEKERAQAIEESDPEKFKHAEQKIKELERQEVEEPPQVNLQKQIHDAAQKQEWFSDDFLRREAIIIGNSIASDGEVSDAETFVETVDQHLRLKYPERFNKPVNKPASLSKPKPQKTSSSGWSKLVAEVPGVEDAFAQLLSLPGGYYKDDQESREKYAKSVFAEMNK